MQPVPAQFDRCRVYIVDDEWMIAQSLAAILCNEGYHAVPFHNSGQVLVRSMEHPPEVLIADVMMPGMNGVELAVALREGGYEGRIVLFSGQSGAHELLSGARLLGYDFELLEKPVHPLQLLLRLRISPSRETKHRCGPADPRETSRSRSAA